MSGSSFGYDFGLTTTPSRDFWSSPVYSDPPPSVPEMQQMQATSAAGSARVDGTGAQASGMGGVGFTLSIGAALVSAINGYYSALSLKTAMKSRAAEMDFAQTMADINARGAEAEAQAILKAGEHQIGQLTMAAEQQQAERRVQQTKAGVDLGVGSAAEVRASEELVKQLDVLTIDANAARSAAGSRRAAVNYRNQALLAGVSARNMRAMSRAISPELAAGASLLGSSGSVASSWYSYQSR